jgi:hypothetical protein
VSCVAADLFGPSSSPVDIITLSISLLIQRGPGELPGRYQRGPPVPDFQWGLRGERQVAGPASKGERTRESQR